MRVTKRNVGFAAALAGLLAVAGCQRGEREERQGQGGTAMQSAERSSEQAAKQQEKAAERAGEAADARQEVREEQKEVAEARGEAQEKTAEAQQAQNQAQRESAQAGQEMDRARQQTAAGQPSGAQAGMTGQQSAEGELVRASADEIVLRTEGAQQGELRLKVSESTPVVIDGREAKLSDLEEGTQVRASFEDAKGERTATRIEAQQSK